MCHSGVVLAGIQSSFVIPAWSWPESRKIKQLSTFLDD
ncbi:hypothetical protein ASZ90_006466 [hydrocarbon metagenome]|uniref:Uncharacterized protein n=1 Tax=hydrocarbon metagenome TaxID=938273 RepID=A0A0W8FS76_9ZZZZ